MNLIPFFTVSQESFMVNNCKRKAVKKQLNTTEVNTENSRITFRAFESNYF